MASAAARAKVTVSSLVSSSTLIIWRKSSTAVLLPAGVAGVVWAGIAAVLRVVDEGGEVELLAEGGLVGVGDQLQVVDAGQGGRGRVVVRRGLGVGVPADDLRDGAADLAALPVHSQLGQVERVEDQLHLPAGQERVDGVHVSLQGHGGGVADQPDR